MPPITIVSEHLAGFEGAYLHVNPVRLCFWPFVFKDWGLKLQESRESSVRGDFGAGAALLVRNIAFIFK